MTVIGMDRVTRWLRHRLAANAPLPLILMYHRVADVESDPWGIVVSRRNFRDQMRTLSQTHNCSSLDELVRDLAQGRVQAGTVCVTFDDGYSDNLRNAKPILEEFSIPATFFLTSGYLQADRDFWWDALEWPFFHRVRIPATLEIRLEDRLLTFDFAGDTDFRESVFARHRSWRAWDPPLSKRHAAYHQLWQVLHEAPGGARQTILDAICNWAGDIPAVASDCRPLSAQEVGQLASGALVTVGGHSVTHPALPRLAREDQEKEVIDNKRRLEELIGRPVRHFAYPHGLLSPDTVSVVKDSGYASACTSEARTVDASTDIFRLPRICAEDWPHGDFAQRLARRFADD